MANKTYIRPSPQPFKQPMNTASSSTNNNNNNNINSSSTLSPTTTTTTTKPHHSAHSSSSSNNTKYASARSSSEGSIGLFSRLSPLFSPKPNSPPPPPPPTMQHPQTFPTVAAKKHHGNRRPHHHKNKYGTYTQCGRMSNEWLFNGFSFREKARELLAHDDNDNDVYYDESDGEKRLRDEPSTYGCQQQEEDEKKRKRGGGSCFGSY